MQIVNPLGYPNWDELLSATKGGSFFHTSSWAHVLQETYNYRPCYITAIEDGKFATLVPLMEVRSLFTGSRGVSLPFTDYCEPIIPAGSTLQDVTNHLIPFGKKSGWKYVELRGGEWDGEIRPSASFFGHVLDLSQGEQAIFRGFRESTRRNTKKAEKEGVTVTINSSPESIAEFYRLNCMTRRAHGLPPQPFRFFGMIHEHIVSRGKGVVALAAFAGKTIAGAVFFCFGGKAIYKYGASDSRYQQLRANNLVMAEAIQWFARNGQKEFCFGRTEPENEGLLQFKRGWGAKERVINYYKYDLAKNSYVKDQLKLQGMHTRIFGRMPVPLLKLAGSLLYRHMG